MIWVARKLLMCGPHRRGATVIRSLARVVLSLLLCHLGLVRLEVHHRRRTRDLPGVEALILWGQVP